jgi:hypothetical protein
MNMKLRYQQFASEAMTLRQPIRAATEDRARRDIRNGSECAAAGAARSLIAATALLGSLVTSAPANAKDPVLEWNQIALAATVTAGQGPVPQIRTMAIVQVSVHDARATWLWFTSRPLTRASRAGRPNTRSLCGDPHGLRNGDVDDNVQTEVDPVWTPLLATPPHPEYLSGHSTNSSAMAKPGRSVSRLQTLSAIGTAGHRTLSQHLSGVRMRMQQEADR